MHIAIIPDGNRRWAKERHLPAFMGHRAGAKTTEKLLTAALKMGIQNLTFWGASINNVTKRDNKEVQFLFKLFTTYFKKIAKAKLVHEYKVHINAFGEWEAYFPPETKAALQEALTATKNYHDCELTFLLAYNGTAEMVHAVQTLLAKRSPDEKITGETIKAHLYTKNLPPVDLVIRTGDDPHLSTGFMMWDAAEAQLYFSSKMYPDFTPQDLETALKIYAQAERRQGK